MDQLASLLIQSDDSRFQAVANTGELDPFRSSLARMEVREPWSTRRLIEDSSLQERLAAAPPPSRIPAFLDETARESDRSRFGSESGPHKNGDDRRRRLRPRNRRGGRQRLPLRPGDVQSRSGLPRGGRRSGTIEHATLRRHCKVRFSRGNRPNRRGGNMERRQTARHSPSTDSAIPKTTRTIDTSSTAAKFPNGILKRPTRR